MITAIFRKIDQTILWVFVLFQSRIEAKRISAKPTRQSLMGSHCVARVSRVVASGVETPKTALPPLQKIVVQINEICCQVSNN